MENFRALEVGKNGLPIADDVIISIRSVGDGPQDAFVFACYDRCDQLIRIQINEARRLLIALGAFLFPAWWEENAPENRDALRVVPELAIIGLRALL